MIPAAQPIAIFQHQKRPRADFSESVSDSSPPRSEPKPKRKRGGDSSRATSKSGGSDMTQWFRQLRAATDAGWSLEQAAKVVGIANAAASQPRQVSSDLEDIPFPGRRS